MQHIEPYRNEPTGAVRAVAPVVPAISGPGAAAPMHSDSETGGQPGHEQAASAADYARANARIADIFADLDAGGGADAISGAQAGVDALLPQPVVIIPLPPASADMVQRAIAVAQDMAAKAALTRSAQANVNPGTLQAVRS